MKVIRRLSFFLLLLAFQNALCQKLDLKTLLEIYNNKSLASGLHILQAIPGFDGTLSAGYDTSDSSINGTINKGKFRATKRRQKIDMMHFFDEEKTFQSLKNDATKSLYLQETTSAISMGTKRIHYVFSNVRKIGRGDLQLIISRCTVLDSGKVYFQLDVVENY